MVTLTGLEFDCNVPVRLKFNLPLMYPHDLLEVDLPWRMNSYAPKMKVDLLGHVQSVVRSLALIYITKGLHKMHMPCKKDTAYVQFPQLQRELAHGEKEIQFIIFTNACNSVLKSPQD